jgi:hypothetical protein
MASDWERQIAQMMESVTQQSQKFVLDLSKDIEETVDGFVSLADEIADTFTEQIQVVLDQEIDPILDQLIQPLVQWSLDFDREVDRLIFPFRQTFEPTLNQHPVCVGCKNYHGQVYNGQMLVCGMHPFGVNEGIDSCPDKEAIDWSQTNFFNRDDPDDF